MKIAHLHLEFRISEGTAYPFTLECHLNDGSISYDIFKGHNTLSTGIRQDNYSYKNKNLLLNNLFEGKLPVVKLHPQETKQEFVKRLISNIKSFEKKEEGNWYMLRIPKDAKLKSVEAHDGVFFDE
jgi:hypothetical protein